MDKVSTAYFIPSIVLEENKFRHRTAWFYPSCHQQLLFFLPHSSYQLLLFFSRLAVSVLHSVVSLFPCRQICIFCARFPPFLTFLVLFLLLLDLLGCGPLRKHFFETQLSPSTYFLAECHCWLKTLTQLWHSHERVSKPTAQHFPNQAGSNMQE